MYHSMTYSMAWVWPLLAVIVLINGLAFLCHMLATTPCPHCCERLFKAPKRTHCPQCGHSVLEQRA